MTWSPGDFIKPDPTLSAEATREHILNELDRYFKDPKSTDRLVRIQKIVEGISFDKNSLGEIIFDILHAYLVDSSSFLKDILPDDIYDAFLDEAVGFIEEDTLPDGSTILSLWLETEPEPEPEPESEPSVKEISFWNANIPIPLYVLTFGSCIIVAFLISSSAQHSLTCGTFSLRSEL
jgi:hypothetical protein